MYIIFAMRIKRRNLVTYIDITHERYEVNVDSKI